MITRERYILERCRNEKVLHLGCCDTPLMRERIKNNALLHFKLEKVASCLYGLDISNEDIQYLKSMFNVCNLIVGDCERVADYFPNDKFDIVVASEIMEHLCNIGLFLSSVKKIMHNQSRLVISVPNGVAFRRGISSLLGRETVHMDHNFYFSKKTIIKLLERNNFEIVEIHGYRISNKKLFLSFISDAVANLFSEFACEGIVLTARLSNLMCSK